MWFLNKNRIHNPYNHRVYTTLGVIHHLPVPITFPVNRHCIANPGILAVQCNETKLFNDSKDKLLQAILTNL